MPPVESAVLPVDGGQPHVKPVYWAYLRACIRLIEAGKSVTQINLSRELRISHQAVWKFVKRHPDVMTFVDDELRASNQKYYGLVQRRMAVLGMQGSPQHAEIFFKSEAGHYARTAPGGEVIPLAGGGWTLNLLVPRPETPGGAAVPASTASPGALIPRPALADIPTVPLR